MTTTEFISLDLSTLKADQLKKLAKEYQVKNWWLLKKADLIAALSSIQLDLQDQEAVKKANQEYQEQLKAQMDPTPKAEEPTKKTTEKKEPKVKAPKVEKDQDNLVTIKELAAEFNMKGTKARRLLRNDSALRPFGSNRWEWDKVLHSEELAKVREILKSHTK